MARLRLVLLFTSALLATTACDTQESKRERPLPAPKSAQAPPLKIVGSETVFPYAAAVAEEFAEEEKTLIPVIESVGTGAGVQLFCRGPSIQTPSALMASRPLSQKDYDLCRTKNVPTSDILEILIGFEGLVFVQSLASPPLSLTPRDLFNALSANVKPQVRTWREISRALPNLPIKILGPAKVSGTYESLVELVFRPFCTPSSDTACLNVRHDGVYMEMGGNQNVLIEKIIQNPKAIGIISFAFFKKNRHRLRGIPLDGIAPSFENCLNRTYPFLRPLYLYIKKPHLALLPKLQAYIKHFFKVEALGLKASFWGYLIEKGLIPLRPEEQPDFSQFVSLTPYAPQK